MRVSRFTFRICITGIPTSRRRSPFVNVQETTMLDRFVDELIQGVNAGLKSKSAKHSFAGGAAAADHVVKLMSETLDHLDPETIIDVFVKNPGRPRVQKMWDALGDDTIKCIVAGAIALAEYWQCAWKEGRAAANAKDLPQQAPLIPDTDLMALYRDKTFMQSRLLSQMKLP